MSFQKNVILSEAKDLKTHTNAFQILRYAQNDKLHRQ